MMARARSKFRLLLTCCGLILLVSALGGLLFNLAMPQGVGLLPSSISRPLWRPSSLARTRDMQKKGALLIDARPPGAYKLAHARGAVSLSPQEYKILYPLLLPQLKGAPALVVYGRSFSLWPAARVAQRLRKTGLARVYVMQASLEQWQQAGYPMRMRRFRSRRLK